MGTIQKSSLTDGKQCGGIGREKEEKPSFSFMRNVVGICITLHSLLSGRVCTVHGDENVFTFFLDAMRVLKVNEKGKRTQWYSRVVRWRTHKSTRVPHFLAVTHPVCLET